MKIANVLQVSIEELLKDSTRENINARIGEIINLTKNLSDTEIDKIVNVIKAMYY